MQRHLAAVLTVALLAPVALAMPNEYKASPVDLTLGIRRGGFLDELPDLRLAYAYNFNKHAKVTRSCSLLTTEAAHFGWKADPVGSIDLGVLVEDGAGFDGPALCGGVYLDKVKGNFFRFLGPFKTAKVGAWVGSNWEAEDANWGVFIQFVGIPFGDRPE